MAEPEPTRRESMSPEEAALFHRWKNEEAPRTLMRAMAERIVCEVWEIQWREDGGHWIELRAMRDDVKELRKRLKDDRERKDTFRRAAWEKVATLVAGAAAALGVGWLSKRTGIALPGVGP